MKTKTTDIDGLLDRLRQRAKEQALSKRRLAQKAGLHANTLAGFNRSDWAPSVQTIRALEQVLFSTAQNAA